MKFVAAVVVLAASISASLVLPCPGTRCVPQQADPCRGAVPPLVVQRQYRCV